MMNQTLCHKKAFGVLNAPSFLSPISPPALREARSDFTFPDSRYIKHHVLLVREDKVKLLFRLAWKGIFSCTLDDCLNICEKVCLMLCWSFYVIKNWCNDGVSQLSVNNLLYGCHFDLEQPHFSSDIRKLDS